MCLKTFLNTFCKGFKSPPFKAIFHAGISGLRSPGIYAWEDVTQIENTKDISGCDQIYYTIRQTTTFIRKLPYSISSGRKK
jgi:hypothetical protein